MRTPEHFQAVKFNYFILECALRDRIEYADCICDAGMPAAWEETELEIRAIKARMKAWRKRNS